MIRKLSVAVLASASIVLLAAQAPANAPSDPCPDRIGGCKKKGAEVNDVSDCCSGTAAWCSPPCGEKSGWVCCAKGEKKYEGRDCN